MANNLKEQIDADKEIGNYLDSTNRSEEEKRQILEDCWKSDDTRAKWLAEARRNKPKPKNDEKDDGDKKKAAASQGQLHDAISAVRNDLILRAKIDVQQAIQHGGIDPVLAAQTAVSNAISKAVDEIRATVRISAKS